MRPVLKNRKDLAKALGLSRSTLYRMEAAGCPFPAGKCSVEWATEWLKANPNFSSQRRAAKKQAQTLTVAQVDTAELAEANRVRDLVFTMLFLQNLPRITRDRKGDVFTRGQWQGKPAQFGYSLDRSFAVVFGLDGTFLGIHTEATK